MSFEEGQIGAMDMALKGLGTLTAAQQRYVQNLQLALSLLKKGENDMVFANVCRWLQGGLNRSFSVTRADGTAMWVAALTTFRDGQEIREIGESHDVEEAMQLAITRMAPQVGF